MESTLLKPVKKLDEELSHNSKAHHPHFPKVVDLAFKWAPLTSLIVLDAMGLKTKNESKNHMMISALGEGVLNAVLQPVKESVHRVRPNYSYKINSFPSGHTATAFLGAEILCHELRDTNKALAYSGYVVAAVTGVLRVYDNKHWFSDVVAGAVLGIASAKLAYKLLKKMNKNIE